MNSSRHTVIQRVHHLMRHLGRHRSAAQPRGRFMAQLWIPRESAETRHPRPGHAPPEPTGTVHQPKRVNRQPFHEPARFENSAETMSPPLRYDGTARHMLYQFRAHRICPWI